MSTNALLARPKQTLGSSRSDRESTAHPFGQPAAFGSQRLVDLVAPAKRRREAAWSAKTAQAARALTKASAAVQTCTASTPSDDAEAAWSAEAALAAGASTRASAAVQTCTASTPSDDAEAAWSAEAALAAGASTRASAAVQTCTASTPSDDAEAAWSAEAALAAGASTRASAAVVQPRRARQATTRKRHGARRLPEQPEHRLGRAQPWYNHGEHASQLPLIVFFL